MSIKSTLWVVSTFSSLVATGAWLIQNPSYPSAHKFAEATIEPAGGHPASAPQENDEVKHGYTGKKLTGDPEVPIIHIGSLKVESLKTQASALNTFLTPATLQNPEDEVILTRTFKFTPYAHNPTRGTVEAPIKLVEFTDLSCGQCRPLLKKQDDARNQAANLIRQTSIHTPLTRYADTNMAAFYGKVAQENGKFWEFRNLLINNKDENLTLKSLMSMLVATGLTERQARQALLTKARSFYRELDADAKLAKSLGVTQPPHFFVNGISIGDAGINREKIDAVIQLAIARQKNGLTQLQPAQP